MIYEDGQRFVAEFPTGEASVRRMMWSNMPVCHPALMIRADVFRAIGLYSAEYDAAEDYDMIRRAAAHGFAIDNVQHVLLQKYETRNSVSWKRRREQLASRLKIQWHYRQLRDPGCLAGLLKTLLLRTMPDTLIRRLKAAIG
jgi:GT2 family glycosyltransferase